MSVVKLSVHKNNKDQKSKKDLRIAAVQDVKTCVKPKDVAGYLILTWSEDRSANICWNIRGKSAVRVEDLPKFLKSQIKRKIYRDDKN